MYKWFIHWPITFAELKQVNVNNSQIQISKVKGVELRTPLHETPTNWICPKSHFSWLVLLINFLRCLSISFYMPMSQ
jgi:hypothetical protein